MAAMKWWKVEVKRYGKPVQVYELHTRSTKGAIVREECLKAPDVEYYYLTKLD